MTAQEAPMKMVVLDPLAEIDRAGLRIGARHIGALPDLAEIAERLALHIAVEERQALDRIGESK
jgi:hypothetical protein